MTPNHTNSSMQLIHEKLRTHTHAQTSDTWHQTASYAVYDFSECVRTFGQQELEALCLTAVGSCVQSCPLLCILGTEQEACGEGRGGVWAHI